MEPSVELIAGQRFWGSFDFPPINTTSGVDAMQFGRDKQLHFSNL